MSAKEQCFKDAINKYQDLTEVDLKIEFEKQWVKDLKNGWAPRSDDGAIAKLFNSIRKTWDLIRGNRTDVRPPESADPMQLRRPDITIPTKNGKPLVIDNKFTGNDGKPDAWRPKPGQSGSTQREDYNDINKQNGSQSKDLSLDKDVCKCNGEPQPVEVPDPALAPVTDPYMVPFVPLPGLGGVPALPPLTLPEFPPLFPEPIFILP